MKKKNHFTNFEEFLDTLDTPTADSVRDIESKTRTARQLQIMRMSKGFTQKELAERIGCTQGNVSKIENKFDEDLTLGDIKNYIQAIRAKINIEIGPKPTVAQNIRKNIEELSENLKMLKSLNSTQDKELSNAIDDYLATSHVQLLSIALQGLSDLESKGNELQTNSINIDISVPEKRKPELAPKESNLECASE